MLITVLVWIIIPEVPSGAKGQRFDLLGAIGLGAASSPCCSRSPRAATGAGDRSPPSASSQPPW
ncbi:hypothetical protein NKG05_17485 [Oerskovia sp. M15]